MLNSIVTPVNDIGSFKIISNHPDFKDVEGKRRREKKVMFANYGLTTISHIIQLN